MPRNLSGTACPTPDEFSWGGLVALETALRHPGRVDRPGAAPTPVMVGDHDFVRVGHAVLPRTRHTGVISRVGLVAPLLADFLGR